MHTPGPWELSEGNTSIWGISPLNARVRLANIQKHSPMNGIDWEANARLIAAAPEMLAALHEARAYIDTVIELDGSVNDENGAMLRMLNILIAKAEGR